MAIEKKNQAASIKPSDDEANLEDRREVFNPAPETVEDDVSTSKTCGPSCTKPDYTAARLEDMIATSLPASGLTFPLQVASLLDSTKLPYQTSEDMCNVLTTLRAHLLAIPPVESTSLDISRKRLSGLGIMLPFADPKESVQWNFAFKAPQDIKVVGSWVMQTGVKLAKGKGRSNCIDLMLEMPPTILQEKDYLSYRYFHKRAHYVACLAASLSSSSFAEEFELSYVNLRNDICKPVLLLKPKGPRPSSTFRPMIRLIPSYPSSLFPMSKLAPSRANLKPSLKPSPRYNQSVLLDSTALHFFHLSYFDELATTHPAFTTTCRLMKIWSKQRGLYSTVGSSSRETPLLFGFESFGWLINFIVAHVLVGRTESAKKKSQPSSVVGSDATVLWQHALDWIAQWNTNSLIKMATLENSDPFPDTEVFDAEKGAFIDPTGKINLIADIPSGALHLLVKYASHSSILGKNGYDYFDSMFLKPVMNFSCVFDYHFMVRLSYKDIKRLCRNSERTSATEAILTISTTLNRACEQRLRAFGFMSDISDHNSGAVLKVKPVASETPKSITLKIGVVLNPTHAFNVITHGPSPDTSPSEAADFREFWGDKCELRRFQDGAIEECVSWEVSDPLERLKIVQQVIRWVLITKLGFPDSKQSLSDFVGLFDDLIVEEPSYVEKIYESDPKCLGFTNAMKCFNDLVKQLKDLNKDFLPLTITSIQPTSEHLRYSSVFVPGPRKMKGYRYQPDASKFLPSMACQVKFESSGKWPEDLEAIQKIKAALLAKISEGLAKSQHVIKAELVFDHKALPISDNVALELLHSSGYAFVLSVCYEREEMLLAKAVAEGKSESRSDCESTMVAEALTAYRKKFNKLKKHHDAIAALQTRFPSFTYTVRIIKRWFAAHLLSSQISPEMIELLASAVYLILQKDHLPPATGSTGFLRFLKLMKEWRWRGEPLLIPLQSSVGLAAEIPTHFPVGLVRPAITNFSALRKKDPGFHQSTYFISTEEDLEGSDWLWANSRSRQLSVNQMQPHRIIADRIQALATASLASLEARIEENPPEWNVRAIFKSPPQDYDFHLGLNLAAMTRMHQSLKSEMHDNTDPLGLAVEIDDDPITSFVTELQRLHGDTVMFFYDSLGGTTISGIFNPLLLQPKTIKTHNHEYLTKPALDQSTKANASTKGLVVMDTEATLQGIQRLGVGIIHRILQKEVDY